MTSTDAALPGAVATNELGPITVGEPVLAGNEMAYVTECMKTAWLSANGGFVTRFEDEFAAFCGTARAIACANGTVALHLAMAARGIGPGDEVVVPSLTYVATANAATYCGATPVLVDVDPQSWTMDPERLRAAITARTKAIVPVHLYGETANMGPLLELARAHDLWVLEDAAEAHGASWNTHMVGSIGDAGTFSFFANKIITTGEGGMVVTNDEEFADRMAFLKDQAMSTDRRYWHPEIGFNYRLPNLQAAIGVAQLEMVDWHLQRRTDVERWYREELSEFGPVAFPARNVFGSGVPWMVNITLRDGAARRRVAEHLRQNAIDSRPIFEPLHTLPMYRDDPSKFPVAAEAHERGLTLPTHALLSRNQVERVCATVRSALQESR